jgi:hypothetical protein
MTHIFVDADACPVKGEVVRVAGRYGLQVTLVAGMRMKTPAGSHVRLEVVEVGMDAADNWIADRVEPDDIVITGDIPLAARCLDKGARVIGHSGKQFTSENIGPLLATRNLLAQLREFGEITGGPPPFSPRDRSKFLQSLDLVINLTRRSPDTKSLG